LRLKNYAWKILPNKIFTFIQAISRKTNISLTKPSIINLDITDRCQLRCLTCTKWKTPSNVQSFELRTNAWKYILLALKKWLGEFCFIFSGGEPFLRKDILEICSFASKNNIHSKVITNGCGFHNLARKITQAGIESVIVSLNGIKPQTHDTTRGLPGAFTKTERFINELNKFRKIFTKKELELTINTILLPNNYKESLELVKWVQEKGIDGIHFQPMDPLGAFHSYPIHGISLSSLEGAGGKWYKQNLEETTNQNLKITIGELIKMKKEGYRILNSIEALRKIETYYNEPFSIKNRCPLGHSSFNIDPYGYVRFCFDMNSIGNIMDIHPKSIFNNRKAKEIRKQIKECNKKCHWVLY
jgi:MoaA/NifB/PqqE/SkfB family radical SAM enzyme